MSPPVTFGIAGVEALGIGVDDIGAYRPGGERVTGGSCSGTRHKAAPRHWRHDLGKPGDI
jgi:hypothetical protein